MYDIYYIEKVKYIFVDGESIYINFINKLNNMIEYRYNINTKKLYKHNFILKRINNFEIWSIIKDSKLINIVEMYINDDIKSIIDYR